MSKAIITFPTQMFQLILAGILGVTFILTLPGEQTKIERITQENYAERDAIALANALISHPTLAYSDSESFFRGMLDKEKLDTLMTKKSDFESDWQNKIYPNDELSNQISFPDSYALIIVQDIDSNDVWVVSVGKRNDDVNNLIDCLKKNKIGDISKLFELDSYAWEVFDVTKCNFQFYSNLQGIRGYPVAIKYPEYSVVHTGLIKVWMVEK